MIAGCASSGSGNASADTSGNHPGAVPVGNVVAQAGGVVSQVWQTVTDVGGEIAKAPLPIPGAAATQQDLGNVVGGAGRVVSTLGNGASNGLGKLGARPDPVGVTVPASW
jgi:hypothetical protein